jgi:REP element-mobilizing transposase RayT
MIRPEPLQCGQYYHIYNRGNNGETLFRERRNYAYSLRLYDKYIQPVAETYAYCLMSNHFHLLVRMKDKDCQSSEDWQSYPPCPASRAFATLFSTYTKALNKAYHRTGSLFEKPFRRKRVDSDRYFTYLVVYIHRNPQKHGLVDDFHDWPYSSYRAMLSDKVSHIRRLDVLGWFDGRASFEAAHVALLDEGVIEPLITNDRL